MKYIKEYLCDKKIPSDEEIRECLEIVENEGCSGVIKCNSCGEEFEFCEIG